MLYVIPEGPATDVAGRSDGTY